MKLVAHFSMSSANVTRCAQVVNRGEGFSVYLYDRDNFDRETFIDESEFPNVVEAFGYAYAFGGDPDMLLVQDENYNDLLDWRR